MDIFLGFVTTFSSFLAKNDAGPWFFREQPFLRSPSPSKGSNKNTVQWTESTHQPKSPKSGSPNTSKSSVMIREKKKPPTETKRNFHPNTEVNYQKNSLFSKISFQQFQNVHWNAHRRPLFFHRHDCSLRSWMKHVTAEAPVAVAPYYIEMFSAFLQKRCHISQGPPYRKSRSSVVTPTKSRGNFCPPRRYLAHRSGGSWDGGSIPKSVVFCSNQST